MDLTPTSRYELPPGGITLLGYIVRRMHKTELLQSALDLLAHGHEAPALLQVALYAVAASTSYGPAYYQPTFNAVGEEVAEPDPATGALVSAKLLGRSPHFELSYQVVLPGGARFSGKETILGTTVGLRGLGMPAPSRFEFTTADGGYSARIAGSLTSELALSLLRGTRIRAYGTLDVQDSRGGKGSALLERSGQVRVGIQADEEDLERALDLSKAEWRAAIVAGPEVPAQILR